MKTRPRSFCRLQMLSLYHSQCKRVSSSQSLLKFLSSLSFLRVHTKRRSSAPLLYSQSIKTTKWSLSSLLIPTSKACKARFHSITKRLNSKIKLKLSVFNSKGTITLSRWLRMLLLTKRSGIRCWQQSFWTSSVFLLDFWVSNLSELKRFLHFKSFTFANFWYLTFLTGLQDSLF